jgi:hypothetical protein
MLQWICELRLPGQVLMPNSQEFLERLVSKDRILMSYNVKPWTAMGRWASSGLRKDQDLLVALQRDAAVITNLPGHEHTESLSEVWPDCLSRSFLLPAIRELICEGWRMDTDELLSKMKVTVAPGALITQLDKGA